MINLNLNFNQLFKYIIYIILKFEFIKYIILFKIYYIIYLLYIINN